ncbi:hypothetical protein [Geotalea sp. SG265]|uniref:hypothetical protein n=1 Tax=Geotalea sp. SG265 TaxID=2922867 RepID=UPI001FAF5F42|nr:hypothetical protein [Geotalea sp. SG265]
MRQLVCFLLLLALTGCSKDLVQHAYLKNYTLGEPQSVHIGEPIIKIRDIYREFDENHPSVKGVCLEPSSDFSVSAKYTERFIDRSLKVSGSSQKQYPFNYVTKINNAEYSVFWIGGENGKDYGLLFDDSGKIFTGYAFVDNHDSSSMYLLKDVVLDPANITMKITKNSTPCSGFNNYDSDDITIGDNNLELVYGGINNVTISLMYREYTWNDLARPSFFQNLVYETGAKEIRFKDFKIEVLELSNEKIVYRVLEDKLKDTTLRRDGREWQTIEKARKKD